MGHAQTCQQHKQITRISIAMGQKKYLLTAITGCAAALFDRITLHSAAFLSSKLKTVTLKNYGRPFFVTGAHDGFPGMCVSFGYLHVIAPSDKLLHIFFCNNTLCTRQQ